MGTLNYFKDGVWVSSDDPAGTIPQDVADQINDLVERPTVTYGSAPVSPKAGDVWIDSEGNKTKVFNGTVWVIAQDTDISGLAGSKNRVFLSPSTPIGTTGYTPVNGDLWIDSDDDNKIYIYNNTRFDVAPLGSAALADSLQTTINTASSQAASATSAIGDILSDDKVTPDEKYRLAKEWAVIDAERAGMASQATTYGIDPTDFNTATTSLDTLLNNATNGILLNMSSTSTISGQSVRVAFTDYYAQRTALLNAIYAKVKSIADSKTRAYYSDTMPTGLSFVNGDIWFDTNDDNRIYIYEDGFVPVEFGINALARGTITKNTFGSDTRISNLIGVPTTTYSDLYNGFVTVAGAANSIRLNNVITENGSWTFSCMARRTGGAGNITVDICDGGTLTFTMGTDWSSVVLTHDVANFGASYHFVDITFSAAGTFEFKQVQVEKGTRSTEWVPSATDLTNRIYQVKLSADSKNNIYYANVAPSSEIDNPYRTGDTWYHMVDVGGVKGIDGIWHFDATKGTGLKWSKEVLQNGVFGQLDAAKITTGFLSASRIDAGTITADKVVLSSGANLLQDPGFSKAELWDTTTCTIAPTAGMAGGPAAQLVTHATTPKYVHGLVEKLNVARVIEGSNYRAGIWVKASNTVLASKIKLYGSWMDSKTAIKGTWNIVHGSALAANTWTHLSGLTGPVPSGASFSSFGLEVAATTAGVTITVSEPFLQQAAGAELIVDGAITTDKLSANAVTAAKIKANTITVNELASDVGTGLNLTSNTAITAKVSKDNVINQINLSPEAITISGNKINIDGALELSNWASGEDSTKIDGGSIYANSITANKLASDVGTGLDISSNTSITSRVTSTDMNAAINKLVVSITDYYALSTNPTTPPASGWGTTVPTWTDGSYIWHKQTILYKDTTSTETSPVNITGAMGKTGAAAINVLLSNESCSVPADNSGNVTSYVGTGTTINVYEGATELTYDGIGTNNGFWKVTASGSNITPSSPTDSGQYATYGDHSAMAQDAALITYTISGKRTNGTAFSILRSQNFTKSKAGAVGDPGANATRTAILEMYQWAANKPTLYPSGSSTYTWGAGTFGLPGTPNGWTLLPGSGSAGQVLWAVRQVYTDQLTTSTSNITWSPTDAYPTGAAGTNGSNAIIGLLSNESATVPANAAGAVQSFATAKTTMSIYNGVSDDSANWTYLTPETVACSISTTDNRTVELNGMSADTASVTLKATRSGYGNIQKTFVVTKSKAGSDGAASTSYWLVSDTLAIAKNVSGVYTPASITVSGKAQTGLNAPAAYAGRFIIAESTDGSTYVDKYPSAANESSKTYTPSAGIKSVRIRMYLAGGTTTLLDEMIVPVVNDGATGARTAVLTMYKWSAASPTTYPGGTASTYTWANGTFTDPGTLNGWSRTIPAKVAGQTLWGISKTYTDTSTTATSSVTWNSTSPFAIGYAGTDGLQGLQGPQGDQGIQGPIGQNGLNSYAHIAYATSQDGSTGFSTTDSVNKTYIGMYTDNTAADSNSPSAYAWTLIKGADGSQGIPGPKGDDGLTPYLHIAYATAIDGSTGFSTTDSVGKTHIGQYVDNTPADSTNPALYAWSLIQGPQGVKGNTGAQGKGISSTAITYQAGTSGTTAPTGTWITTIPSVPADQFLWTKVVLTYTDAATSTSYSVGKMGAQGAAGKGISSTAVTYQAHTNGTTAPTGTWQASVPAVPADQFLWTRIVITYTDATTSTSYSIGKMGAQGPQGLQGVEGPKGATGSQGPVGATGTSVTGVTEYYLATSAATGVTSATLGWTTTIQTMTTTNKYLWNYEVISFSDSSTSPTIPVIIGIYGDTGATGATGRSLTAVTEYYLATSAATGVTRATGGWNTAMQSTTPTNKYLWNYEKMDWSSGTTPTYIEPIIIGTHGDTGAKGDTGAAGVNARAVSLSTPTQAFTYNAAGTTPSPAGPVTITATGYNTTGTVYYEFLVDGSSLQNTTTATYPYTPKASVTDMPDIIICKLREGTNNSAVLATDTLTVFGVKPGTDGETGQGIDSITEEYYLSTSKTTQTNGSWVTSPPTWSTGKYIWTRSKIVYKNPASTVYTTPVVSSEWEAANDVKDLVYSKGTDLVTNGTAYLGNNTNFTNLTYSGADAPTGASGSFYAKSTSAHGVMIDEFIPFDPSKKYKFGFQMRQTVPAAVSRAYGRIVPYDISKLLITPEHYMFIPDTLTTLAAPLNPGDTTITLTNSANWYGLPTKPAGANTYQRSIIFWDYVDDFGKAWPELSYSRNIYSGNRWADGGINATTHVITLSAAYNGPAKAAGTKLSNGSAGSTYVYMPSCTNVVVPETWTTYADVFSAGIKTPTGTQAEWSNGLPPGTASIKVGWLLNYPSGGGKHAIAAVSFSDASAATSIADTSVKSTDVEYYLSTSATSPTGGSWTTTAMAAGANQYIWTRTKTVLNNGTTTYVPSSTGALIPTGLNAFTTYLTNEAHTFAAATNGDISNYDGGVSGVRVFYGATELTCPDNTTTTPTVDNTYKVTSIAPGTGTITVTGTAPSGQYVLTPSAMTTDFASKTITIVARVRGINYTFTKNLSYSKSKIGDPGAKGDAGASGVNTSLVRIYARGTTAPALPSTTATYTFSSGALTGQGATWTTTVPSSNGNPLWTSHAMASATAPTDTDTIAAGEWVPATKMAEDGASGAAGYNSTVLYLYQRSATAPVTTDIANPITYTFSSNSISGTLGAWSRTVPTGTNPLYVTSTYAYSNTATDTVANTEWSTPIVMAQNGASGTNGISSSAVRIYKRAATSPTKPSTTSTYTFSTGLLTGQDNGWTIAVPVVDGNPLWTTHAIASATYPTDTDTIATGEWAAVTKMLEDGATGYNSTIVYLYQRSASAPTKPSVSLTYTFSSGVLSGTLGSWTQTVPSGTNPLYVTTAYAYSNTATDSIAGTEWSNPVIMAQDGAAGAAGKVANIIASSQIFKSTDGGIVFSPDSIVLTPSLQIVTYSKWQYSTNGGTTWVDAASGSNGITIGTVNAVANCLTLVKTSALYTSAITSVVFKLVTNDTAVSDTVTISKLYDVADLKIGASNLVKNTSYLLTDATDGAVLGLGGVKVVGADPKTHTVRVSEALPAPPTGARSLYINNTSPSVENTSGVMQLIYGKVIANTNLVLSFYTKASTAGSAWVKICNDNFSIVSAKKTFNLTTDWQLTSIDMGTIPTAAENMRLMFGFGAAIPALGDNGHLISSIMLEYGTKPTNWFPAPQDFIDSIAAQTIISDTIKSEVLQTKALADTTARLLAEFDTEVSNTYSSVEQTSEAININLTTFYANTLSKTMTDIENTFKFTADGLKIAKSTSPYKVSIDNDSLDFLHIDPVSRVESEKATISGDGMKIPDAYISNSLHVGYHQVVKFDTGDAGNTVFRWIGEQ